MLTQKQKELLLFIHDRMQASGVPRPDVKPLLYWNRGYRQLTK